MGGPDMAPHTPRRSDRRGEAVAIPDSVRGSREYRPGESGASRSILRQVPGGLSGGDVALLPVQTLGTSPAKPWRS